MNSLVELFPVNAINLFKFCVRFRFVIRNFVLNNEWVNIISWVVPLWTMLAIWRRFVIIRYSGFLQRKGWQILFLFSPCLMVTAFIIHWRKQFWFLLLISFLFVTLGYLENLTVLIHPKMVHFHSWKCFFLWFYFQR